MEKNYNVDLEKLDKVLDRIITANLVLAQSETLDEHARARYRSALAQLTTVQQCIRNPEFFNTMWDLYMLADCPGPSAVHYAGFGMWAKPQNNKQEVIE